LPNTPYIHGLFSLRGVAMFKLAEFGPDAIARVANT
jgi:hypothetical protein